MGLFSFGKKKKEDGFEFIITESFPLKNTAGAVVSGRLRKGRFAPGTKAVCLDENGTPVCACRIEGIEQGTQLVKIASSDAQGSYGNHYGVKLGGVVRAQIPSEGTLVPETQEYLDYIESHPITLQQTETAKKLTYEDALEEINDGGPLGQKREEELAPMLKEEILDETAVGRLNIQECIFLLNTLQRLNAEEGIEGYQEKGDLLYTTVLDKLANAPLLYTVINEETNLPFILQDTVDVYTTLDLAMKAVEFYRRQHYRLYIKEVPRDNSGLPGNASLFAWLFFLGMERILVDNGAYKLLVKRSDMLTPEEVAEEGGLEVPVANPGFRFAMADFLEEARWDVTYNGRADRLEEKAGHLTERFKKAKFLVPLRYEDMKQSSNPVRLSGKNDLNFPLMEDEEGKKFLPLFTDWLEFQGSYDKREWGVIVLPMKDVLRAASEEGVIINPLTEKLVLDRESLEELKELL